MIFSILIHEFGHFIFDIMPERYQIAWYSNFDAWIQNEVKLTRDTGKNEVEELFADTFSILYNPNIGDFITEPSSLVIDTFMDLVSRSFNL